MLFAVYFFVKKIINAWCGFIEKFFVVFKVQLIFFFIYNMFCLSLSCFLFYVHNRGCEQSTDFCFKKKKIFLGLMKGFTNKKHNFC